MKLDNFFIETDLIKALFHAIACAASGRKSDEFGKDSPIDIDYKTITHSRFFATIGLICCQHAEIFDKTKSEIKAYIDEGLERAWLVNLAVKDIADE